MKENLGKYATDKVTGTTGVITGAIVYIGGNTEYLIAPPVDKEGKHTSPTWFSKERVTIESQSPLRL